MGLTDRATEVPAEAPPPLVRRCSDFLFGYDYFISYAWEDGRAYALALKRELESEGFECFLDSEDYLKGDNWRIGGRRAIRKTSRLILVGSAGALASDPVLRELEAFHRTGRRIVPIDFGGTLFPDERGAAHFQYIDPEVLAIREAGDRLATGPSEVCLQDLRSGFDLQRQDRKRLRWLSVTATTLAALLVVSTCAALGFLRQRDQARRNLGIAIAKEAARMVEERRWLAASALLEESLQYPASFEAYLAALGARKPWLEPLEEIDLGSIDADWISTSKKGRLAALGSRDGRMIFLLADGEAPWPARGSAREGQVDFSQDERSLWFAAEDEGLISLSSARDKPHVLGSPAERPNRVILDPLSDTLLVGSAGVGLWQLSASDISSTSQVRAMMFNEVSLAQGGEILAATDFALGLHLWRGRQRLPLSTLQLASFLDEPERQNSQQGLPHPPLALSKEGSRVATILDLGDSAALLLFDPPSGRLVRKQILPRVDVVGERPVTFAQDGSLLFVRHKSGILAFSAASGELAWRGPVRPRPPSSFAIDPQGRFVAVAFESERIELLSLRDGSLIESVDGHSGAVGALAFSGDGSTLLSASSDGRLRRWAVAPSRTTMFLLGGRGYLSNAVFGVGGKIAVAFPYNGAHLVATYDDSDNYIAGHPAVLSASPIAQLAWSEDGEALAVANGAGQVRVWHASQPEVATLPTGSTRTEIRALLSRPGSLGFFALREESLDVLDAKGELVRPIAFPEPWSLRRGPFPLGVEGDRFAFLVASENGTQLVEWSTGAGWRKGPVLQEEPLFIFMNNGRTLLVERNAIRAWTSRSANLEEVARLTHPIPHGGPAALLASRSILARPAGDSSGQHLELGLEFLDLSDGTQKIVTDPETRDLVADSENFILSLGEGATPGTLLSVCRSSLILEWGLSLAPGGNPSQAATGLEVEGTSVRPAVSLVRQ